MENRYYFFFKHKLIAFQAVYDIGNTRGMDPDFPVYLWGALDNTDAHFPPIGTYGGINGKSGGHQVKNRPAVFTCKLKRQALHDAESKTGFPPAQAAAINIIHLCQKPVTPGRQGPVLKPETA